MTMPATEEKTAQLTELPLAEAISSEQTDTSPETDEATNEAETTQPKDSSPAKPLTTEQQIQSAVDKAVNQYRETRESDTALIRSQVETIRGLKSSQSKVRLEKLGASLLQSYDEEGLPLEEKASFENKLKEYNEKIAEYNEQSASVEEVVNLADTLVKTMDKRLVDRFDLSDSNPVVKAKGVTMLISEAIFFINREEAFNKILEEIPLLQKGSEVRQQIDSFIKQWMELPEGKSRDLLIEKLKRETNPTAR